MRLRNILRDIDLTMSQGSDTEITWITIDSRKVIPGSLFICIRGLHQDGHNFIIEAVGNGAAAIIVDYKWDGRQYPPSHVTVVKVRDCREALSLAASNYYGNPAKKLNMIGITGTNGKTSSTYFMEGILKEIGHRPGLIGTVETRINGKKIDFHYDTGTTPDPMELQQILAKMRDEDVDDVCMEVTSHALEFHKVAGMSFDLGVFTNLTQDHLDLHKTMENYKRTKAKLFKQCRRGIVNADDPASPYMMMTSSCKFTTYGIEKDCDVRAYDVVCDRKGIAFKVKINEREERFTMTIPGRFTVYNALSVIGVSLNMGIPVKAIQRGLANMEPVQGRIQSIPNHRGIAVIVDYSHTPDSLENIIKAVRGFTEKRVITVFGCGGDRDKAKRPIMGEIAGAFSDYCIITSDNPRSEDPEAILLDIEPGTRETRCPYEKLTDRRQAIFKAIQMAQKGDSVIIAGKGHENYQIFAYETIHFDDSEVAKEALEGQK